MANCHFYTFGFVRIKEKNIEHVNLLALEVLVGGFCDLWTKSAKLFPVSSLKGKIIGWSLFLYT